MLPRVGRVRRGAVPGLGLTRPLGSVARARADHAQASERGLVGDLGTQLRVS